MPQGLTATAVSGGRIDLVWNASTDSGGSGLAGYRVFRDGSTTALAAVTAAAYSDTSVVPATQYSYALRAFDMAGNESAASAAQTVTTPAPPGAPTGVAATAGNLSAVVAWAQPGDGGRPITGYTVTPNPGGIATTVGGNATSAIVTGLANGTSYTFTVFATNAVGNGPHSAASAAVTPSAPGTVFPLVHSPDQRYLQGQNGVPFPILGRTAFFIISLAPADYQLFIDDSLARGYNAIEMHVIDHDPRGRQPPFNGRGDLPFLKSLDGSDWHGSLVYANIGSEAPDFTTPNEAYWSYVDTFLAYAESRGAVVFFFPVYAGFNGGEQGWMMEMVANGPPRMNTYGAWIAARYANRKNLVWMASGNMGTFTPAQSNVESALLDGLRSVAGQSVDFSAEWETEMIATDQTLFGPLMTLNGVYSHEGAVSSNGRRAYATSPPMPAYLLEEPYDEEGPDGTDVNLNSVQPVRRFQWWGWLATIGGTVSGNGFLWPFSDPNWKIHLDTQGSRDMARLNAFIKSIPWWNLVPSGLGLPPMKTIVTSGGGVEQRPDYVAAAATRDGSLMIAYVPPAHAGGITIDMTVMSGPATARWLNPATGAFIPISTSLPNTGSQAFVPVCDNGPEFSDCVLVLEKNP